MLPDTEFFQILSNGPGKIIGDVIRQVAENYSSYPDKSEYILNIYNYQGDPAVTLH